MNFTPGGDDSSAAIDGELRKLSEERAPILQQLSEGVIIADTEGRLVFVNEAAERLHGVKKLDVSPDAYSKTYSLFTMDGEPYPFEELPLARAVLKGATVEDAYWRIRRPDGTELVVVGSARPLLLDDRQIGAVLTLRDESKRFETESAIRESEARFRNLADSSPMMVWVTGPDGACTFLSNSWYEFTGQTEAEALGFGWLDMVHPDDQGWSKERFLAANEKREAFRLDYRLRYADGSYRWAIDAAAPRFGKNGTFLGYVGSVIDIDDLKRTEEALADRNRRLDLLARIAGELVVESAPSARLRSAFGAVAQEVGADYYFNYLVDDADQSTMRLHSSGGLSPAQEAEFERISVGQYLCGRVAAARQAVIIDDLDRSDDPACRGVISLDGKCYAGFPLISEGHLIGTISFASGSSNSFSGDQIALMRTVADQAAAAIDRNRIMTALIESESKFRMMAENVSQLAWTCDLLGNVTWYNKRWLDYTGLSFEEMKGWGWDKVQHPDHVERVVERVKHSAETGEPWEDTFPLLGKDGQYRWFLSRAEPIRDEDGKISRWFGTNTDVTAQRDAEKALRAEIESRFVAENALTALNETLEERVAEEIALRSETEEALRQSQKMETLGQLTGGIAHDFNNLLQVITGNLDIISRNLSDDSPRLRRSIEHAAKGADRAAVLTQRLLAFSRRQPLAPKVIDPNKLVSGMSEMLHRTLGETVQLETVLGSGLWRVEVDPNQLEGALLNLAVNSRDAMDGGGKLTIETANTHLDRAYAARHRGVAAGQYVVTCVSDTGAGMDEATAERAVDPFFTTKEVGKGTGLGLSMVYGFVKQSEGHLKIYSEPGEGTTVKIYLPRHHGAEEQIESSGHVTTAEGADGETILVCEDDDDVRAYSVETLRELGYRVIEAADGESALRLLAEQEGIDLLFTDIVLPGGMTGAMVAERARKARPGLKVLFTTGYARNAIVHHGRVDPGVELLSKPFAYAELASRIRDLLDTE